MTSKILVVPDSFFGPDSGAIAARSAARVWQELGCEVAVYAMGEDSSVFQAEAAGPSVFRRRPFRGTNHIIGSKEVEEFKRVLDEYQPTHVFFLGSAYSKPAGFFRACRKRNIRTIALWWVQDFFCARGYSCLPEGPCNLCIDGHYQHSFKNNCSYTEDGATFLRLLGGAASRAFLKPELRACDVVMGSSEKQLELYRQYGVEAIKLIKCPLFFETKRLQYPQPYPGDYFVCYGQSRFEKGWHLLKDIIQGCPDSKFVLPFYKSSIAEKAIKEFDLEDLLRQNRVRIVTDVMWSTGAEKIVAESRGVLLPSVWPTTTEYTLLESLGLGKPVVVFDVGIHSEIFVNGVNGLVAKLGDVCEFSHHIETLAKDDELYNKLSVGARKLFERLTAPENYRTAFRQALAKASR